MSLFDDLRLYDLKEDPENYELAVKGLLEIKDNDLLVNSLLKGLYCDSDRSSAFTRYLASLEFKAILNLISIFSIDTAAPLCEIGGGPGFLAWALKQSGFSDVSLLEPSNQWLTGTGYLRTRRDSKNIKIVNDLESWYSDQRKYKTIITRNVLHHFRGLTYTIACIQQKIEPSGYWIVVREPTVESASELHDMLAHHPFCQPNGVYEFAYPSSQLVRSFELVGFTLDAVVPREYCNNALRKYIEEPGNRLNRIFTGVIDSILYLLPNATEKMYRFESLVNSCFPINVKLFTRPQVLIFRKVSHY